MASRIFYYSRSGNCARLAHAYATEREDHMVQIMDLPEDRYWGALGFCKAVFSTVFKFDTSFRLIGNSHANVSDNVLITPIWVNQIPPTIRAFLKRESFTPDTKITVVTVSSSGNGSNAFQEIVQYLHNIGVHQIQHRNIKTSEIVST